MTLRRTARIIAGLGCALLAFALYLNTLAPTVLYYDPNGLYDSVMLQVQAYVLDVPNPTGYPTYVLLTHLFTYLPLGDAAYRVNLASALYAALAVLLLFAVCLKLTGRVAPSAAAALLFGLSRTFWSQAVIAEVYTLNALFVGLTLLTLLAWREEGRRREEGRWGGDRYLLLGAFLMGLSLTHHLTSGLLVVGGLLFVLLVEGCKLLEWRLVLKGVGLFVLGLLPYLYLPLRASMDVVREAFSVDPTLVKHDPSTFGGFYNLVTGAEFNGAMFVFGPAELPERASYYLRHLSEQAHPAFLAVALVGVAWLLLEDRAALALFGSLYLGWLFHALEYDIRDVYFYFIPTYLVLAVFVAVGLAAMLRGAEALAGKLRSRGVVAAAAVVPILSVSILLAPLAGVGETYGAVDQSGDYEGRRQIEAVVENAKPGATVLHHRSPLWYMLLGPV